MSVILFLVVFSILVVVHECGHFFSARALGVRVEEFGLGFPPRLWSVKTKSGMVWSVNVIPIGGFVRLEGEETGRGVQSFASQPVIKRIVIVTSGVLMNVFLAYVITSALLVIGSAMVDENIPSNARRIEEYIAISGVIDSSPAQRANLQPGDRIKSIDGYGVSSISDLQNRIRSMPLQSHTFVIRRSDQIVEAEITPTTLQESQQPGIGVELLPIAVVRFPIHSALKESVLITANQFWMIARGFFDFLQQGISTGQLSQDVVGPVGIARIVGSARQSGWPALAGLMTVLSLNLALINILPIPALDGGRFFFLLLEAVRGRPIWRPWETRIHQFGFLMLLLLMVLITVKDLY